MTALFGVEVRRSIATTEPEQVEGEEKLLGLLTVKIGPYADKEKMLYHLRITRGRVPWAVNSYFRATCAISDNTRRDFEPSPFAYRPEPASNMELIADVPCNMQVVAQRVAIQSGLETIIRPAMGYSPK
eukprot:jgi/Tetstr1/444692/TSEL_032540.t1